MKVMNTSPTHKPWKFAFIGYILFLLTVFALAYLKLIPVKLQYLPLFDTIGHFMLLGIASYLSHRAFNRKMISLGWVKIPLGPLLISIFIMIEEFLQSFSPYRTMSLSDIAANLSGIILFYLIDWVYLKIKHHQRGEDHA
ncbi:VanZ family protein [Hazenella coriacea]|uniref:VanZ like protein n=1 Tax=Hazenella coriacea TaxID=1179467 RepID=A0A4V2UV94_9BACL|nr:VanZ family protein [Hazenella coriacea]TCS94927.1 hypothetical protein EDD58_103352 [Hazenella coriacea]